jgi:S-adenosyl-L-methionine hydrolase (adenosine-forming)
MQPKTPLIGLLTDFGLRDQYVGAMKAAIASLRPDIRTIDVTHEVGPHNIGEGAYLLWASYKYFPVGAVLVAVVDPGVGSKREIIGARTDSHMFLAPDNGILDLVLWEEKIKEVTVIRPEKAATRSLLPKTISSTFHGRDIFAPLAAHLAAGTRLESLGNQKRTDWLKQPFVEKDSLESTAVVLHIDRFGNIITNIREGASGVRSRTLMLKAGKHRIHGWADSYEAIPSGNACMIVGSSGLVEIVMRERNAAALLGLKQRSKLNITFKGQ